MSKPTMDALRREGILGPLERKNDNGSPADVEVKAALADLAKTNKEFQDRIDQEIKTIKEGSTDPILADEIKKLNDALDVQQKTVDQLRLDRKRPEVTDPDGTKREMSEAEVKHRDAMRAYMRKGDDRGYEAEELKSLSVGSDPDGGYTITPELDRQISRVVSEVSPIRALANVVQTSTSRYKRLINVGGTSSGWVGESESRPQTDTSQLREREYPVMELYAMPAATQSILDDSSFNMEAWLADEVQIEFAEQEGNAFIMGDGVAKPRGFIGGYTHIAHSTSFAETAGGYGFVKTGVNGAFASTNPGDGENNLIDLIYALKAAYRSGARFVMNSLTLSQIRKMRDANGLQLWQPSTQAGQPSSLLGYPVVEAEDMPDLATDSYSVAFGDFNRAYQVVDRMGTRILRDPYTAKPFVLFYTTKRVGGGARMFEALKLLKFAA